eukprot:m.244340 g.244340  ORF g.244340 m.244340 type:complete len:439 (+) comp17465_c0_seq14:1985-3301(+)
MSSALAMPSVCHWLHGRITHEDAERLILKFNEGRKGSFLIRVSRKSDDSSGTGCELTLAVEDGKVESLPLRLDNNGIYRVDDEVVSQECTSIEALVQVLSLSDSGYKHRLTLPVPLAAKEAAAMLQAAGAQEGSYVYHARASKEDEAMLAVIFKAKCTFHSIARQADGTLFLNGKLPQEKNDITDIVELLKVLRKKGPQWPVDLTLQVFPPKTTDIGTPVLYKDSVSKTRRPVSVVMESEEAEPTMTQFGALLEEPSAAKSAIPVDISSPPAPAAVEPTPPQPAASPEPKPQAEPEPEPEPEPAEVVAPPRPSVPDQPAKVWTKPKPAPMTANTLLDPALVAAPASTEAPPLEEEMPAGFSGLEQADPADLTLSEPKPSVLPSGLVQDGAGGRTLGRRAMAKQAQLRQLEADRLQATMAAQEQAPPKSKAPKKKLFDL